MSIKVHPEFVPEQGLWCVDHGVQHWAERSLRELQSVLPKGCRIEGYYPNGYRPLSRPQTKPSGRPLLMHYQSAQQKLRGISIRNALAKVQAQPQQLQNLSKPKVDRVAV